MAASIIRASYGRPNPRDDLTAEEARAVLSYNPCSGILRWKVARCHIDVGQIAGYVAKRRGKPHRLNIIYHHRLYPAARIIWLIVTGEWPQMVVDHKDRNPFNNRWSNLRLATGSQNSVNRDYATTSPYRGVRFDSRCSIRPWRARISLSPYKRIELGFFLTAEDAHEAYKQAALKYHGEFARLT
jgi:hypothetical protein